VVDFTLSAEQLALREFARDATFPEEIIAKAWGLGLMNCQIPARYGGAGIGYLDGVVIEEELAWGCAGIQSSIGCNALAVAALTVAGSEQLKKHHFERLTHEPLLAAFCLTEPAAGSDVAAITTRAVRSREKYVISGSKSFITNGGHAGVYVVCAKTDPDAGHRGLSCFVVPREAGVLVGGHEDKMGQRASNTATVSFPDVEIPAENRLGDEGDGFKIVMMALDRTRPAVAAIATGLARAAFEFAVDYAQQRTQFGVPIAQHQAIQFLIADMATGIEAARLLTWKAAVLLDQDRPNTLLSSHAKRFAADVAMKVTTDAVQVYGGHGYMKDRPVEKLMRDAKIMQIYEGTSEIQRIVIAREVLQPDRGAQ
jgi:acyl-CoA dehydrogenase